ncbi:MAG: methylmalonyl-CoA epimerase [Saprospiraceae bacterium]|jgi:methylmalonyl-CoA/ethylmalonyl-CoA epimerase|nr:methylmalonyl-CoA epimerase [Saprospiraceae bacterium]
MSHSYAYNGRLMSSLKKIEHIGIAVSDLDQAEKLFSRLLGAESYKREVVESESVITSFFKSGPNKIELLAATNATGPIQRFLEKKGEGIHHIAFAVDDINFEMQRLKNEGFELLNDQPKLGADNKWVCFIHPRSTGGTLIELCQDRDDI